MIKHVQQENDEGCVHACIAMVTGNDFQTVWDMAPKRLPVSCVRSLLKRLGYRAVYQEDAAVPMDCYCLVTVPSLNQLARNHMVVFDMVDGFRVYDPNRGRYNKKWYVYGDLTDDLKRFTIYDWSEVLKIERVVA